MIIVVVSSPPSVSMRPTALWVSLASIDICLRVLISLSKIPLSVAPCSVVLSTVADGPQSNKDIYSN